MKNLVIVLLLAAAVSLGALTLHQRRQLAQAQTQLADTQDQLKETQAKEKFDADERQATEQKAKLFRDTLARTTEVADAKTKQAEQLQQSLAAAKTNSANPLAAMFKDPKMKEMIKASQKAYLGPMLDKQYAALFQQLNLTPEQTATLKDLLQKKMQAGMDAGMSLMDDSLTPAQRTDLAKQIKSDKDGYDAQIQQFLGDENYQAFQAYEKTTPDRTTVSQFGDQLSGGPTALSPDQQAQLIQAMSEERNGFKWTTDYNNPSQAGGDMSAMFSDDKINQFAQEKAQLDQQVFARAQQILTPDQLTAFQQFQTSQRDMQMAGMKMAAKMFAPKSQ